MVIILFRNAKGAPQILARAEADEFINQLLISSQIMGQAASGFPLRKEGTGGTIQIGEDVIEVGPQDVAIEINFDPEAAVTDSLGAEPTDIQLHLAAVTLDETARFHIRQGLARQMQAQQMSQAPEQQHNNKALRVVKSLQERDKLQ